MMTIALTRNTFATGSIEILNLIILIRVLTFIIPVIPTLTPISLTDPRASTAYTGTRQVRGMRSKSSRHGLSILMVTESTGNIDPYKSYSNSVIKKKHYTPLIHNTLCDGVYCTEDSRFAIYHYYIGKLIIPHHYFPFMFNLIKTYTLYAPKYLTITDTSIHIYCRRPVLRPTTEPLKHYVPKHRPYRFIERRFNWT